MHTSKREHDQAILLMPASSRQRALRPRLPLEIGLYRDSELLGKAANAFWNAAIQV
jgi:hypothetical protein